MPEKLTRSAIAPKNPLLHASRVGNLPHVPGIRVGDYIFLSGMVPIDPQTGERSHGPIAEQVRITLSNMQHMLESAGSSLERVVRVHVVLADISHMAKWIACIANFFRRTRQHAPPGRCSFGSATAARSSVSRSQAERWQPPKHAVIPSRHAQHKKSGAL
jgi:enamine deaminase RidA (YjgF/YER057c/UK114 family)